MGVQPGSIRSRRNNPKIKVADSRWLLQRVVPILYIPLVRFPIVQKKEKRQRQADFSPRNLSLISINSLQNHVSRLIKRHLVVQKRPVSAAKLTRVYHGLLPGGAERRKAQVNPGQARNRGTPRPARRGESGGKKSGRWIGGDAA